MKSLNKLEGRFWITKKGRNLAGSGRIELLKKIQKTGSILKAAKEMGMSYKAAWDSIDLMNKLSDTPLVERSPGGKNGGGTHITQEGIEFISLYEKYAKTFDKFLSLMVEDPDALNFMDKTKLSASTENVFYGKVEKIEHGAVNCLIHIMTDTGLPLVASITESSAAKMDLKNDGCICALINANRLILAVSDSSLTASARNVFQGTVSSVTKGAVNSEVVMEIGQNAKLKASITNESVNNLELTFGKKIVALCKASDIILLA